MNRKQRRAEGRSSKSALSGASGSGAIEQAIFGRALQFHQSGRLREAETGYREVLALNSRHAGALCYLGLLAHQSGHSDAAIDLLKKAIASDRQNPELHYNLGCVLSDRGRDDEALIQYRKAVELKPDYPDALNNLGALLLLRGETSDALAKAAQGLKTEPTPSLKSTFASILQSLDPSAVQPAPDVVAFLAQALTEPWCRPRDISGFAGEILFRDRVFARSRKIGAHRRNLGDLFTADELALLSRNPLLPAVLSTAPVTTIAAETMLTTVRAALLADLDQPSPNPPDEKLRIACAIARQCFINEYVFQILDAEQQRIDDLRNSIAGSLERGENVKLLDVAVLACYVPLHFVPNSAYIAAGTYPEPLSDVMAQQISEVAAEKAIRTSIEKRTPIENAVWEKVREQYEQNPYPRWTKVPAEKLAIPIDRYIASRFPGAPYKSAGKDALDILIAGCGTGMHAIQRAQQFSNANVLAVDLSLSSLSYAIRKTNELGISNIRYAQADILALDDSQIFDLIDSSGVLHHLENPLEGWRRLLRLLRAGGLMHIGLYSRLARADVNLAREHLAKNDGAAGAAEIRKLRGDILELPDGAPLKGVTRFSDFFSMSECRDLLFHVQEHQFSISEIGAFLAENGLRFIGFETRLRRAYLARFPDDPAAVNLENWAAFEAAYPDTFSGMYQFWVQKP